MSFDPNTAVAFEGDSAETTLGSPSDSAGIDLSFDHQAELAVEKTSRVGRDRRSLVLSRILNDARFGSKNYVARWIVNRGAE